LALKIFLGYCKFLEKAKLVSRWLCFFGGSSLRINKKVLGLPRQGAVFLGHRATIWS